MTIETLKPSKVKKAIQVAFATKRAVFIWGPPGIGKSSVVQQVSQENGYDFVDVRLSQMAPEDIRGVPVIHDMGSEKTVRWTLPYFFPRDPNSKVVLFFDEMNAAAPSVQAAAYQIVLDRKIGEYTLPENTVIIAAGNRETDRGVVFKMPTPLANRFIHLEMCVDFNDFYQYGVDNNFHRDVIAFLNFKKEMLYKFDPNSASRGFPTPRSWNFVSDILNSGVAFADDELTALIAGAIGSGAAIEFVEYRKETANIPSIPKILSGEIKEIPNKEISIQYAVMTAICYELAQIHKTKSKSDYVKALDNVLAFMMANFIPELVIFGICSIMRTYKLPIPDKNLSNWNTFISRYKDLIVNF